MTAVWKIRTEIPLFRVTLYEVIAFAGIVYMLRRPGVHTRWFADGIPVAVLKELSMEAELDDFPSAHEVSRVSDIQNEINLEY